MAIILPVSWGLPRPEASRQCRMWQVPRGLIRPRPNPCHRALPLLGRGQDVALFDALEVQSAADELPPEPAEA